jgi:hypothetical protein
MAKNRIIERKSATVDNYTITWEGADYKYKIQEPTFEQLSAALTESMAGSGKLNMAGGGKVIFELCCPECDQKIRENTRLLIAICLDIYTEYVLPTESTIKKN